MDGEPASRSSDLWQRAASFSARMHAGQVRKDGVTPYASHPFRVALSVRQVFGIDDPVCLAIALLHDVIEDTPADYDDVAQGFGEAVAKGVAALTKDMRLPEDERERDYDEQLQRADWRSRVVKLADVYDNLCDRRTRLDSTDPRKSIEKVERAVAIATAAGDDLPQIEHAVEVLRGLVRDHERAWRDEQGVGVRDGSAA